MTRYTSSLRKTGLVVRNGRGVEPWTPDVSDNLGQPAYRDKSCGLSYAKWPM